MLMLMIAIFSTIHLTSSGLYLTKEHAIYTALTTIVTMFLTALISEQIKSLLFRKIDVNLQSLPSASKIKALDER